MRGVVPQFNAGIGILRPSSFDYAQDEETVSMALRKSPHPERSRRAHNAYPALKMRHDHAGLDIGPLHTILKE